MSLFVLSSTVVCGDCVWVSDQINTDIGWDQKDTGWAAQEQSLIQITPAARHGFSRVDNCARVWINVRMKALEYLIYKQGSFPQFLRTKQGLTLWQRTRLLLFNWYCGLKWEEVTLFCRWRPASQDINISTSRCPSQPLVPLQPPCPSHCSLHHNKRTSCSIMI